jgi:hypothetical protein
LTAQGHPQTIFKRAIEHDNVVLAEMTARELGRISLADALRLLFLYAEKEPIKYERAVLRWLGRYVTEGKGVSLLKAQLALTALAELRAGSGRLPRSSSRSWRGVSSFREGRSVRPKQASSRRNGGIPTEPRFGRADHLRMFASPAADGGCGPP